MVDNNDDSKNCDNIYADPDEVKQCVFLLAEVLREDSREKGSDHAKSGRNFTCLGRALNSSHIGHTVLILAFAEMVIFRKGKSLFIII